MIWFYRLIEAFIRHLEVASKYSIFSIKIIGSVYQFDYYPHPYVIGSQRIDLLFY
jgi:hypothetical protein